MNEEINEEINEGELDYDFADLDTTWINEFEALEKSNLFGTDLPKPIEKAHPTDYWIRDFSFDQLNDRFILQHSSGIQTDFFRYFDIEHIVVNQVYL